MASDNPGPSRGAGKILAGIALAYLWIFPYHEPVNNPNENVRVYMTRAIVEDGTFAINAVEKDWGYVNDKAIVDKTLYSAKAPGTSLLGVPVYVLARAGNSFISGEALTKSETVYWLRLGTIVIPSIVFLIAFYFFTALFSRSHYLRLVITTGLGLGTMSFTYGEMFAGHALVAIFSFGSFMCLYLQESQVRTRLLEATFPKRLRWIQRALATHWTGMALAGFLVGWAAITEYPAALMGIILGLYALGMLSRRALALQMTRTKAWTRGIGWMALGALVPLGLAAFYHQVCFGSPIATAYSFLENPGFVQDIVPGFMGISTPEAGHFAGAMFSANNGLYWFSPFLLLCTLLLPAGWLGAKSATGVHSARVISLVGVTVAIYTLFISSLSIWHGGWTAGPRYILLVGPFLALGGLIGLDQVCRSRGGGAWSAVMSAGVLISVVTAGVSTITFLQWPNAVLNPIFELGIPFLRDGYVVHNAGHVLGLEGTWSMLPFYLIVAAVLLAMILGPRWQTTNRRLLHAATALLIAASAVSFMHSVQTSDRNVRNKFASLMHKKWRPAPGPSLDLTKQQVRSAKTPEVLLQLGNHAAMSGRSKEALKHYAKRVSLIDNTFE